MRFPALYRLSSFHDEPIVNFVMTLNDWGVEFASNSWDLNF